MKIHTLKHHADDLSQYEMQPLIERKFDEVWYWYVAGSYEGSGWLVARKGNKFGTANLGHCSCYGPDEAIFNLTLEYNSFEELKARHSEEAFKEIGLDLSDDELLIV